MTYNDHLQFHNNIFILIAKLNFFILGCAMSCQFYTEFKVDKLAFKGKIFHVLTDSYGI